MNVDWNPSWRDIDRRFFGHEAIARLVRWSISTVESIFYLSVLDQHIEASPSEHLKIFKLAGVSKPTWDRRTVQTAHARWSSGSALTAVDLCAAALARIYVLADPDYEYSVRHFDKRLSRTSVSRRRLSDAGRAWIDKITGDVRYNVLLAARNPLVHSSLTDVQAIIDGKRGNYRVAFEDRLGQRFDAHELVGTSCEFAYEHVQGFLASVHTLEISPSTQPRVLYLERLRRAAREQQLEERFFPDEPRGSRYK